MVNLITKVYFVLVGFGQVVFLYEILDVFTHNVVYPSSILNYLIGYSILAVLIVDILITLDGLSRYVSFLTLIPAINIIAVGFLAYKLSQSLWTSFFTSLIWFINLLLSLTLPVPAILAYGFDLSLLSYMVLQDVVGLTSLALMGILIVRYEKSRGKLINEKRN
ncbi:hypothetical protein [Stygiolobus caldivivus]|uniref:Uncharacterized protein n=1 Tax=Stygiolobus caldivivus TaxID=2824673 RepID=A0A8D5U3Q9_9CREN|nr:hypothetical protein [Stygiolobus caldivivus]BCU68816.1 hypothetical protein KN1_01130 [Stygiolobus caldivivus]